jgi:DNA-binding response OmpR family regulator
MPLFNSTGDLLDTTKILVVSSNTRVLKAIARSFKEYGYSDIHCAADGEEALVQLKDGDYTCIIADFVLRGMHGIQLLQCVRRDWRHAKITFILMSGETGDEIKQKALGAGATKYLQQPCSFGTLHNALIPLLDECCLV